MWLDVAKFCDRRFEFSVVFRLCPLRSSYLHSSIDGESSVVQSVADLTGQKLLDLGKTLGTFVIDGCNSGFLCIVTRISSLLY